MAEPVPSPSNLPAPEPISIVAGIGCRRKTDAAEIIALVEFACAAVCLPTAALVAFASLDRKADELGLLAAAAHFGLPLRTFTADQLTPDDLSTPPGVEHLVGVRSVAEAAASRAGVLLLGKQKSAHATCALARCGPDFDLANFGQRAPVDAVPSTASTAASSALTSNAGP